MNKLSEKNVPFSALKKYVPTGHSPKIYLEMTKHLMGTDQSGNARPFEDLMIFMMTAKRTGLDPMAKQIYPIYRWDSRLGAEKLTIQVGIDGMRATAQKTGEYAGSDDALFEEKDGQPIKATVTVYKLNTKTGDRMPTTATARMSEYVQTDKKGMPMGMWKKMPFNQLAKCAEALALRKAFPNDLSGVYSEDEMAQANALDLPAPTKKVEITDEDGITHDVEVPETHPIALRNDEDQKKNIQVESAVDRDGLKKIHDLKHEIEYEEMELKNAEEYPTETAQFYAALTKQRAQLNVKKEQLRKLEEITPITTDQKISDIRAQLKAKAEAKEEVK